MSKHHTFTMWPLSMKNYISIRSWYNSECMKLWLLGGLKLLTFPIGPAAVNMFASSWAWTGTNLGHYVMYGKAILYTPPRANKCLYVNEARVGLNNTLLKTFNPLMKMGRRHWQFFDAEFIIVWKVSLTGFFCCTKYLIGRQQFFSIKLPLLPDT